MCTLTRFKCSHFHVSKHNIIKCTFQADQSLAVDSDYTLNVLNVIKSHSSKTIIWCSARITFNKLSLHWAQEMYMQNRKIKQMSLSTQVCLYKDNNPFWMWCSFLRTVWLYYLCLDCSSFTLWPWFSLWLVYFWKN